MTNERVFSSFRDPSGFVFLKKGIIYRQINKSYAECFEMASTSGLFESLMQKGKLLPFDECDLDLKPDCQPYKIIKPALIDFISYPYEWSFSQLKDAALLSLDIHIDALDKGMILKDASAYNIQFLKGKPIFIDHLSFDIAENYTAWPAYGQFCRHFLAPLALMSYTDVRLNSLLKVYIDGIPLDLASKLLPVKAKLHFGLDLHLFLHAKTQLKYSNKGEKLEKTKALDIKGMKAIATSLHNSISKLKLGSFKTEWGDYYSDTNYSEEAMSSKKMAISLMLRSVSPSIVWDLGGNTGVFSKLAVDAGAKVVCFDIDPLAVEQNYLNCREFGPAEMLPLVMDFTNPSPGLGYAAKERESLTDRGPADLLMALALIHHLAISNNLPFAYIAKYFSRLGDWLLIEFVPKSDSQVQRLLISREDIFSHYTQQNFENTFSEYFEIVKYGEVKNSERTIYLMKTKQLG
ncbi:SAM-dependent methyltransferase [Dethiosulfatarculus sandiegensis]|uniref:SAM-dependent methyltransferase n=1 Tax=Dethiosulfatarculus sandiegensis TaxID=1429043 RepID=A0A0D2J0L8_9BACT|nr:SAM-dependent methyltransferase [Dethiosulfatarculus sandiegensis]KIX11794.1 hypothetical protein X474_22220 [Dethiosulfatarculus sandiegensis]